VPWPARADERGAIFCSIPETGSPYEEFSYVRLFISKSGRVTWNGTNISAAQFNEYVTDVRKDTPPPTFHITIASNTSYGVFQPVVEDVQNSATSWITLNIPERGGGTIICNTNDLQRRQMPSKLHVWLRVDGQVLWNGAPITKEILDQWSRAAARKNPRLVVNIHSDTDVTYGEIIGLMTKFISAGLHDFAIGRYGQIVEEHRTRTD
jgi:biopolymer transport protein ExbD